MDREWIIEECASNIAYEINAIYANVLKVLGVILNSKFKDNYNIKYKKVFSEKTPNIDYHFYNESCDKVSGNCCYCLFKESRSTVIIKCLQTK